MALIFYPVRDHIPHVGPGRHQLYGAVRTGEPLRPIEPGEWYISGAIPEAYRYPVTADGPTSASYLPARIVLRPTEAETQRLIAAATYAVADFRVLAQEAGESDPATSPALRAAQRLADVLRPFTEGITR